MPIPPLVGMVHLGPLPGSPRFSGDFEGVLADAASDAATLAQAGFGAIMLENFGDAPFYADDVPKVTIAALTTAVNTVYRASRLPIGVNVLRNDAIGALSVAAATAASFIRVNVLSGTMYTDQGPIVGRAADVARLRQRICPDVEVMADVFVKHAVAPAGLSLVDATHDLVERSGADAVVVSGRGTGAPTSVDDLSTVVAASDLPVFVGSGVTRDTVGAILDIASGVIVGTDIKLDGVETNPFDPVRAEAIVTATTRR
ncbi:MAG: BtpA/SgcQ family protein [Acidimicrobiia bacterium]|nr:BtpA/SgcQ family protein [Acidimicrobiia bacterium]